MNGGFKVLIAAPIAGAKQYSIANWLEWIANQDYENFEIALCVNGNEKKELIQKLKQTHMTLKNGHIKNINILQLEDDDKLTTIQRITYAREKLRRFAIKDNYDFLFFLDTDTIPMTNKAIEYLIKKCHYKKVYSGLYFYKNSKVPVVIDKDTRTNISLEKLETAYNENAIIEVWGFGFGVLMISRSVFKECAFDYELFGEERTDDFGYCAVLTKNNIKRFLDPRVICEHLGTVDFKKLNDMTSIDFVPIGKREDSKND